MKKYFFLFFFCAAAMLLPAQKTMYVWQGNNYTEFAVADVDSVTFAALAPVVPEGALSGLFSVSSTKQVCFSMGNLQYTQSTQTWSFAAQQYEFIGTDNVEGGNVTHDATYGDRKSGDALADKIDLFGWSGSTGAAQWGVSTSTDYNDYSGDFADWGHNIGDGTTWRTLTYEEWNYLLNTRANASTLQGVARINLNADGSEYANGLILLPDSWIAPAGVTFKSGFASGWGVQAYAIYQTLTLDQWQTLEKSGAVFFPASGGRNGSVVSNVGDYGYYWSATPNIEGDAWYLRFRSDGAYMRNYNRNLGHAVRLVQDAK